MSAARRVRLDLSPSLGLALAILCAHGMAAASVILVLPNVLGGLLGLALAALGLAAAWSRALLRAAGSVRALELEGEQVVLQLNDGRRLDARVSPRRYVSRWMVTLPVLAPVRRTVLITADMAPPDLFRLLRIWAAWGKTPAATTKQLPA